jgi:hypothetical protein
VGVQHLLAKMTAQCPGFEISIGGVTDITADDVRTALGIVQYREKLRGGAYLQDEELNPIDNNVPLAVRLIEAKYLDDERSRKQAAWKWTHTLYLAWWHHDAELTETISKAQLSRIAYLMVSDYCVPEHARIAGDAALAQAAGMDYRVWQRKYARFYGQQMRRLWSLEAPMITALAGLLFARTRADC